ncbi:VOC family protein [Gordonia hankookensis]|uniref:Glyoxalase n=1 Tax=Gordonia hankookensis TaxID=589403 RepID=A0ABR7WB03_9ACTN|nr:VOC family protein [Gordonia hankookensis]MBD1319987.1 glyoxalase [Gordonia hankookensis]
MSTMLFVNLPVADVARSRAFFTCLGFRFDAMFCDQGTVCMEINDCSRVVLHAAQRFAGYAAGAVADPYVGRESLVAVSAGSRSEVDRCADAALTHGGSALRDPEDLGFMYCRSFCDLDGHAWEVVWMDASQIPADDDSST